MVQWLPTTGEFGLCGRVRRLRGHQKLATRVGLHYTHSVEDKQSQPGTERHREQPDPADRRQQRLHAGPVRPRHHRQRSDLQDDEPGRRHEIQGLSLEAEYYRRWLSDFTGVNTGGIPDIATTGISCSRRAMAIPKTLQAYFSSSQIFGGVYGDDWEVRAGVNWFP